MYEELARLLEGRCSPELSQTLLSLEGRQGKGARTVLASPATAAACAVAGTIADPRNYPPLAEEAA